MGSDRFIFLAVRNNELGCFLGFGLGGRDSICIFVFTVSNMHVTEVLLVVFVGTTAEFERRRGCRGGGGVGRQRHYMLNRVIHIKQHLVHDVT